MIDSWSNSWSAILKVELLAATNVIIQQVIKKLDCQ